MSNDTQESSTLDSAYPEHQKQAQVLDQAQTIGEFIDHGPYVLATYETLPGWDTPQLVAVPRPIHLILADYFGIDLATIDAEKRAMLTQMTAAQTEESAS